MLPPRGVFFAFRSVEFGHRLHHQMWSAPSPVNRSPEIRSPVSYALWIGTGPAAISLRPEPVDRGWQQARWWRARSTCGAPVALAADLSAYSTKLFQAVECHRRQDPRTGPRTGLGLIDRRPQNLIEAGNPDVASNT